MQREDPTVPLYDQPWRRERRNQNTAPGGRQADVAPALGPGLGDRRPPIVLPGFHFMPEVGTNIDVEGEADIAAGSSATLITLTVPAGQKCRLAAIGFGADDEVALRFATWTLQINGDPTAAYGINRSNIGTLGDPATIYQAARNGDVVTVVLAMNAAAVSTYHLVVRLVAWFYVETYARAYL